MRCSDLCPPPHFSTQAKVDNVTAKEKELKVTQKGLEAMREQVALKTKQLEERDKERETREQASSHLKVSEFRVGKTQAFFMDPFFAHTGSKMFRSFIFLLGSARVSRQFRRIVSNVLVQIRMCPY